MSRKRSWTIKRFLGEVAYPQLHSNEFTVRVRVVVEEIPDRIIYRDLTPDQADALAEGIRQKAAEARRQTEAKRGAR